MPSLEEAYNSIPVGRDSAVTREELGKRWGLRSERAMRDIIARLRAIDNGDNYVIVSLSQNRGYYRTDNLKEIMAYKKETTNRARHTFSPLKKVNRILTENKTSAQMQMFPANTLKEAREAAGIPAQDVVEIIKEEADPKFNKITMSLIENNKALPTAAQLTVLSRLYRKSIAELVGMEIVTANS
ncbi:MAG: hypothetical protein ACI4LK_09170 [Lentihominibacter sp.]